MDQTCRVCGVVLVKQNLKPDNTPAQLYDSHNNHIITFGKHNGKVFSDLSKKQIAALLEARFAGWKTYVQHPDIYCNLHRFMDHEYPDWGQTIFTVCKCNRRGKIWSCPVHGIV